MGNQNKEDDFINPNNASNGYGNEDDDGADNAKSDNAEMDDEKDKALKKNGMRKRRNSRRRKMSSFNKQTANEYMEMGLRIAGSFGAFCTLNHVMSLDKELQENDKKGYIERKEDRYNIDELKDFEK